MTNILRKIRVVNALLTMALLLFACGEEEAASRRPILLSAGSAVSVEPATRAPVIGTQLPVGDEVGVFGYTYTGNNSWNLTPNVWDNNIGLISPAVPGEGNPIGLPIRYYADYDIGATYSFTAYYPFVDGVTAANPIISGDLFAPDDEPTNGQHDWMWSRVRDITAQTKEVALQFKHLTSMLWISGGTTGEDMVLQQITVETETSQAFELDIARGAMDTKAGGMTEHTQKMEQPIVKEPQTLGHLLLLPRTQVTKLTFTISGKRHATPDSWTGFATGRAGTYNPVNLVLNESTLSIEIGVAEWEDGGKTTTLNKTLIVETIMIGEQEWEDEEPTTELGKDTHIDIDIGTEEWNDEEIEL